MEKELDHFGLGPLYPVESGWKEKALEFPGPMQPFR